MPNRAQRRKGTTAEVYQRAQELDLRRQEQIARQVDAITRLQHQLKAAEDYIGAVDRMVGILIMAAGGKIAVPDALVEEFDDDVLVRTRLEDEKMTVFTTKNGGDDGEE